ncbi:MAG: class I SAM-dependent methyltransferase [Phycisphaeraceae bacterium]|nr:class I SAM-dependent methyltransferase [Phycisphaeraceae bacterium]
MSSPRLPLTRIDSTADPALGQRVRQLESQGALMHHAPSAADGDDEPQLALCATAQGLELRLLDGPADLSRAHPLRIDFGRLDISSPAARSSRHPLFRALGIPADRAIGCVVDATAGLGEDSWLMASRGFQVIALERHPVVAAMLEDSLARASINHPDIAARISVICLDSASWLAARAEQRPIHALLLDPMYPDHGRRKALPGKEMRILRMLVGDDDDAADLLRAALSCPVGRTIVKRPVHAPKLIPSPPADWTIRSQRVRYDVYRQRTGAAAG